MRTALVLALLVLAPLTARAQPPAAPDPGRPDFLFGRPDGSLALRGGWVFARAGSDLYDFVEDRLTIEDGDFNRAAFATDYGVTLSDRTDIVFGFEYNRASIGSEYRNLVESNREPIEQTTTLAEANLTGSIRFALAPRGREVSRLAWVPRRVVPYAGAGGGMLYYDFTQAGDFVDEGVRPGQPMPIFTDTLRSKGWTPSAHVFGGVDLQIHHRWYLTMDGRYVWAAPRLESDFERFEPLDLSGFRFGAGINVVF
jgi:hypothetical protein